MRQLDALKCSRCPLPVSRRDSLIYPIRMCIQTRTNVAVVFFNNFSSQTRPSPYRLLLNLLVRTTYSNLAKYIRKAFYLKLVLPCHRHQPQRRIQPAFLMVARSLIAELLVGVARRPRYQFMAMHRNSNNHHRQQERLQDTKHVHDSQPSTIRSSKQRHAEVHSQTI